MNAPRPPYYAVIFTSVKTDDIEDYEDWNDRMVLLVKKQEGYLGHESYRNEQNESVTISYWRDPESIVKWRNHPEHQQAQELGRSKWYQRYRIRICRVEREYEFER